jgi:oligosaccharide repeat unit polymerase
MNGPDGFSSKTPRRQNYRPLWWMSPAAIVALLVLPLAIAVHFYTPEYISVDRNFYNRFALILCLLGLGVFILGATIAAMAGQAVRSGEYSIEPRCLDLIGGIAILAYLIWFRDIPLHPRLVMDVVAGSKMNLRDDIGTLPGITTLVQFGVCYAVLYSINLSYGEKLPRRHHVFFILLGFLALFRSLVWSERLALIEYFIPFILFYFAKVNNPAFSIRRIVLSLIPYISMLLSFTVFSVGEYFRSWKFFAGKNLDFTSFMLDRWIGYYYTSMNNGAALISLFIDKIPDHKFFFTLNWFYQLPGIGPWLYKALEIQLDPGQYVLTNYLNPEFNVFSGIFPIFFDFGIFSGLLVWIAAGVFYGTMYAGFATRRGLGLIVYPTLFISLLELLRQGYFFSQRFVYILVACYISYAFFRKPRAVSSGVRAEPPVGTQVPLGQIPSERPANANNSAATGHLHALSGVRPAPSSAERHPRHRHIYVQLMIRLMRRIINRQFSATSAQERRSSMELP